MTEVLSARVGLQRVLLDDGAEQAYVLTDLIGDVAVGDEVVVNTTAVELGLGYRRVARRALEPVPAARGARRGPGTS